MLIDFLTIIDLHFVVISGELRAKDKITWE